MNFSLFTVSTTTRLLHGDKGKASASAPTYTVTFVTNEGEEIRCEAHEGESVLDVAHRNDVDLEGRSLSVNLLWHA